jgi:Nucleoside-diphosphate-sugar epimerases
MKRIGITGAFGLLGSNIVATIYRKMREGSPKWEDTRITAFAYAETESPLFPEGAIDIQFLDVLDYGDVVRKFDGLDALIHLAGRVDGLGSSDRRTWDLNVMGTKNVFDACIARDVGRLLYVSSICALGASAEGRPADESSRPYGDARWPISFGSAQEALRSVASSKDLDPAFFRESRSIYLDSKSAGLELAEDYARRQGLPVVIVFPGTVVGAGDRHRSISCLVDSVWEGSLRRALAGGTSFVAASDFAEGALLALAEGRIGESYIISGRPEQNLLYREFQAMIGEVARQRPRPLPLPGSHSYPTSVLARRGLFNFCSSAKAAKELGYEPAGDLRGAILDCRRFGVEFRHEIARRDLARFGLDFSTARI